MSFLNLELNAQWFDARWSERWNIPRKIQWKIWQLLFENYSWKLGLYRFKMNKSWATKKFCQKPVFLVADFHFSLPKNISIFSLLYMDKYWPFSCFYIKYYSLYFNHNTDSFAILDLKKKNLNYILRNILLNGSMNYLPYL